MTNQSEKGGRPRKPTQVMSCRVPAEFKRDFEAEAQKHGVSNGDLVVDTYNTLQEALGEIENLQQLCLSQRLELDRINNALTGPRFTDKTIDQTGGSLRLRPSSS